MKSNCCVYILATKPVFNLSEIPDFDSLSKEDSQDLYKNLVYNHRNNVKKIKDRVKVVFLFDSKDKDRIPVELKTEYMVTFIDTDKVNISFSVLAEKYFNHFHNNVILFDNTIGISSGGMLKAFDMLSIDDEAFIISKDFKDEITLLGFNNYNQDLFENFDPENLKYENFSLKVFQYDFYFHILDKYLRIKDKDDFKLLYDELSKKDSLNYCNEEMHEKFTNLFIEYKDLLK